MAYEHERITGNRIDNGRPYREETGGSGGVILVLGGAVLAVLLAMFLLGGPAEQPSVTDQPVVVQPETTVPAQPQGSVAPAAPEAAPAAPQAGTPPAAQPAPAPAD
ncbi:hypothetical protein [Gemmobacter sp.]|uniref:hypothetical protein n=1 Tax=Gemmobacter sp. TaxID=1898957 RepID=UPI002AFF5F40|nr:hypothetical protein [Gemmobacter sp.]